MPDLDMSRRSFRIASLSTPESYMSSLWLARLAFVYPPLKCVEQSLAQSLAFESKYRPERFEFGRILEEDTHSRPRTPTSYVCKSMQVAWMTLLWSAFESNKFDRCVKVFILKRVGSSMCCLYHVRRPAECSASGGVPIHFHVRSTLMPKPRKKLTKCRAQHGIQQSCKILIPCLH